MPTMSTYAFIAPEEDDFPYAEAWKSPKVLWNPSVIDVIGSGEATLAVLDGSWISQARQFLPTMELVGVCMSEHILPVCY